MIIYLITNTITGKKYVGRLESFVSDTNGEGPTYDGLYSGEWKHPTMASHHD